MTETKFDLEKPLCELSFLEHKSIVNGISIIERIDDVPCFFTLSPISRSEYFRLSVDVLGVDFLDTGESKLNPSLIASLFVLTVGDVLQNVENLKFSETGEFIIPEEMFTLADLISTAVLKTRNPKTTTFTGRAECCVCYILTKAKLKKCKHVVCLKCALRIENNSCPLCREALTDTSVSSVENFLLSILLPPLLER